MNRKKYGKQSDGKEEEIDRTYNGYNDNRNTERKAEICIDQEVRL